MVHPKIVTIHIQIYGILFVETGISYPTGKEVQNHWKKILILEILYTVQTKSAKKIYFNIKFQQESVFRTQHTVL